MEPTTKHQFSLRRMLIAVTIVGAVLAVAISFPIATAEWVTVNLLLIAPSAFVFNAAVWFSKNRQRTTIMLIGGVFLGWLISPKLFVSWSRPPTFWDEFNIDFDTIGLFMFGGAIAAAVLDIIVTLATHKPDPEERPIRNG
ncbi:MAG: hypothetical protein AAFN77_23495 [Planctomycetota bacterium]